MQWRWGIYYGKLWMFQWALNGSMSLGIHVDPLYRIGDFGPYGPYVDLHIGPVVASFGYHPARGGHLRYLTNGAIMRPERTNEQTLAEMYHPATMPERIAVLIAFILACMRGGTA